jgi:hypothetical protein
MFHRALSAPPARPSADIQALAVRLTAATSTAHRVAVFSMSTLLTLGPTMLAMAARQTRAMLLEAVLDVDCGLWQRISYNIADALYDMELKKMLKIRAVILWSEQGATTKKETHPETEQRAPCSRYYLPPLWSRPTLLRRNSTLLAAANLLLDNRGFLHCQSPKLFLDQVTDTLGKRSRSELFRGSVEKRGNLRTKERFAYHLACVLD